MDSSPAEIDSVSNRLKYGDDLDFGFDPTSTTDASKQLQTNNNVEYIAILAVLFLGSSASVEVSLVVVRSLGARQDDATMGGNRRRRFVERYFEADIEVFRGSLREAKEIWRFQSGVDPVVAHMDLLLLCQCQEGDDGRLLGSTTPPSRLA